MESILNLIDTPIDNPKHVASPYMFIPNGFVIADISKSSPIGWHDSSSQFVVDTKEFLLNNLQIVNEVEEVEEEKIPTWFKTRARLCNNKSVWNKHVRASSMFWIVNWVVN